MRHLDHHNRRHSSRLGILLSACGLLVSAGFVLLAAFLLTGCSKEEEDPLEYVKKLIPRIEHGLNRRDIAELKSMGTERFEANRFITDVYSRGVQGDVSLSLVRFRHVPGQVRLELRATFGINGEGGRKKLTINFSDKTDKLKMDTYAIRDEALPSPETKPDVFDSLPSEDTAAPDPS